MRTKESMIEDLRQMGEFELETQGFDEPTEDMIEDTIMNMIDDWVVDIEEYVDELTEEEFVVFESCYTL